MDHKCNKTEELKAVLLNNREFLDYVTTNPDVIKQIKTEFEEYNKNYKKEEDTYLHVNIKKIEENFNQIKLEIRPDNALRMIQLLEKYQANFFYSLQQTVYNEIINDLMTAKDETSVVKVFEKFKNRFNRAQVTQLEMASMPNKKLLELANDACKIYHKTKKESSTYKEAEQEKKKYCREIEGRLLRTEIHLNNNRSIEKLLMNSKDSAGDNKYHHVINYVSEDFCKQSEKMHDFFFLSSKVAEEKGGEEKGKILGDILSNWEYKPHQEEGLIKMRNQFLNLERNIASLEQKMKKDRYPWRSHIHAALVALGCITIIGLPATFIAMYQSKRYKGTVFFTHAPETRRIVPAAEKSLGKLGRIK